MHLNSQSPYFLEKNYLSILESHYMRLPERLNALISLTEYSFLLRKKKSVPISNSQPFLGQTVIPKKEPQIIEIIAR